MRNHRRRREDRGYPRPQLQRDRWISLNGRWDFALDPANRWRSPEQVHWDSRIVVPFAPETPLSGIGNTGFFDACWYRRTVAVPELANGQRLLLHFGAVDYLATVWVDDRIVAWHEGGYTPFSADITELVAGREQVTIAVRAEDDPQDLAKPRGKQDWQLEPHGIWYPRTTGIWQTVWMEKVSPSHVAVLRWTPDVEQWHIQIDAEIAGPVRDGLRLQVRLSCNGKVLSDDTYGVISGLVQRDIRFSDPGIDNYRNEILWYPHSPTLIQAELKLTDPAGSVLDEVRSYTALRGVSCLGNRFVLNGKPYHLQLVLNQGYWADGGMTAPSDDAFRRDVELIKDMGFNGVRMHQKIEDPRFLYWCDTLGLLVWEEMPSPYQFSQRSVERLTTQWAEAIRRDSSRPCIVAWVPLNESWGVPDLPDSPTQRHLVQSMYHLTKSLDSTRPVIGNDGWEAVATDIVAIHDYDADTARLARRYAMDDASIQRLLRHERPGHKVLVLENFTYSDQPIMLTEFGGIAFSRDEAHTWGYSRAGTAEDFAARYARLMETVRSLPLLAGFCYTQFTDTYQEANGLLTMDRKPKFPLQRIAVATRGARSRRDTQLMAGWRKRLMAQQE